MKAFIGFAKKIVFIGEGESPIPPRQVAWDAETPWDNAAYWT